MTDSAPSMPGLTPQSVISFWREAGPQKWFSKDTDFDRLIAARFGAAHDAAKDGRLSAWQDSAEGTLALIILLDQFPRNMFRDSPRAFATDEEARKIASAALDNGFDQKVPAEIRTFFYLPFMHSEQLADQDRCLALYRALGNEDGLRYAEIHADIIRRFGRFPHRNAILGRASSAEEIAFLEDGGFRG